MTDDNFLINSAAVTDRGLSEKRPQNEDSYLEMQNLGLFAVADGVGGAQAGDVASQMAMEILGEAFVNLQSNSDAEEMMRIAIERANNAIYQMSTDLPQLSTMATTIVALHLAGNIATIGHVGDSRLYRLDARGSLYRETQDHSVVEEEVRAGRMTAAQAANHPSRNVISRALGAENTVEVDMKTIMFEPNTTFLLCSDGITRHITDFEIRDLLISSPNPAEICSRMKEICYSRGAEDNLTAVIIKVIGAAVGSSNGGNAGIPIEAEEATVASARPAAAAPVLSSGPEEDDEIPTQNLQMPESMQTPPLSAELASSDKSSNPVRNSVYTDTDEQFLMEEGLPADDEPLPEPPPAAAPFTPAQPKLTYEAAAPPRQHVAERDFTVYPETEKSGSGVFGKLMSSLLLLLAGSVLGFGAYYFWMQMNPAQTQAPVLTPQTNTIPFAEFEKIRREVDRNPDAVKTSLEKITQRDAADSYLLGRAKLLTKDYEGARNSFIEARNLLPQYTEEVNKANLANDITMGLTIVQNETVRGAFEREMKFIGGGETNGQPNANSTVNTGVAGAPPATDN